jgi:hypothetical protein
MPAFDFAARLRAEHGVLPARTRRRTAWLLASALMLLGASHASGGRICKPVLTFKEVQLSKMQPPTLERKWTATVVTDASPCATTAGYFKVGFSRLKEGAPEIDFQEEFIWSAPSVKIGVDFWADEAVETCWIYSIQACPCAR